VTIVKLPNLSPRTKIVAVAGGSLAVLGVALAIGGMSLSSASASTGADSKLAKAVQTQFPNTKITSVNCKTGLKDLCEVVAGRNVFYASKDAHYVIIGQVLDLHDKVDLTDRRLRELAAMGTAEDRITGALAPSAGPQAAPAAPQVVGAAGPTAAAGGQVIKVDLPAANAVVHNKGAPTKLTVFADYNCGYCHKLFEGLKARTDIEITEYPIAILGEESAVKAKRVLCAKDPAQAANALYYGGSLVTEGECASGAARLQQNLEFARAHGITGTPMLIRSDGATNSGWLPTEELDRWLRAAPAKA
jgi:thiol:disulfide interchange protein DsbC